MIENKIPSFSEQQLLATELAKRIGQARLKAISANDKEALELLRRATGTLTYLNNPALGSRLGRGGEVVHLEKFQFLRGALNDYLASGYGSDDRSDFITSFVDMSLSEQSEMFVENRGRETSFDSAQDK